mgnify:CR=1 FL=1
MDHTLLVKVQIDIYRMSELDCHALGQSLADVGLCKVSRINQPMVNLSLKVSNCLFPYPSKHGKELMLQQYCHDVGMARSPMSKFELCCIWNDHTSAFLEYL